MLGPLRSFSRLGKTTVFFIFGFVLLLTIVFANRANSIPGETFRQPPEIRSSHGILKAKLVAAPKTLRIGGKSVKGMVYNGLYVPPTLRFRPGDKLEVQLVDQTSDPTNIHYHGMNVSPIPPADSIFVNAKPSKTYNYRVPVPVAQTSGTYWYHSHQHMLAERQVMGGLSGGMIVEGVLDDLVKQLGIRERVMLLKDIQIQNGMIPPVIVPSAPTIRTVNGLVNPTIAIAPGEIQLWRIGNIGADIYYQLQLEGHTLYVVGQDGIPVNRVVERQELLLPAGKRYDVLVQGGKQGEYALKTLSYKNGPAGFLSPTVTLATLRSQGQAKTSSLQALTMHLATQVPDLRQSSVTRQRDIVFSEDLNSLQFFVNGKLFDPNRLDTRVPFGSTERWIVKNISNEQHVFHIHQLDFQVVSVNGVPQEFIGYQDTVNVPQTGEVEIIVPFTEPVIVGGKFVYHCHILGHEERGMMATIEVFDDRASSETTPEALEAISDSLSDHKHHREVF